MHPRGAPRRNDAGTQRHRREDRECRRVGCRNTGQEARQPACAGESRGQAERDPDGDGHHAVAGHQQEDIAAVGAEREPDAHFARAASVIASARGRGDAVGTEKGRSGDGGGTEQGRSGDGGGTEQGRSGDGGGTEWGRRRDGVGTEEGRSGDGGGTEQGRSADGAGYHSGNKSPASDFNPVSTDYCLSYTITLFTRDPANRSTSKMMVIVLPSSEMVRRAVANTLPACPRTASAVYASTLLSLMES